jgi:hypothetical protein
MSNLGRSKYLYVMCSQELLGDLQQIKQKYFLFCRVFRIFNIILKTMERILGIK